MPGGVTFNGDQTHPLTAGSRLTKGGLMLDDPERFPVVWKNGAPFHHP